MSPTDKRIIVTENQITDLAPASRWTQFIEFFMPGVPFSQLILRRRNGNYLANKALPILVPEQYAYRFDKDQSLPEILATLYTIPGKHLYTVFLYQKRPITYLPWPDDGTDTELKFNVQLELPGGLTENGELAELSVKRELLEETGIKNILASAPLLPRPIANDAGTHQERYGLYLIICSGQPQQTTEQTEEGIERAEVILLADAFDTMLERMAQGYLVEWAVPAALGLIKLQQ